MPLRAPTLPLAGGTQMPALALGTWPMNDAETAAAVASALTSGYRHIDTAENYGNERGVGEGIRNSGIPREEIFLTTKFNRAHHSVDGARAAFEASCHRLGVTEIDLLLVHWPNPDQDRYVDAVRGLAALRAEGRIGAFGVSNFTPRHLARVVDAGFLPEVNQIQLDPEHTRPELQRVHHELGIVTTAYSPLGRGGAFLTSPAVLTAAAEHGRTPAQVVLRWHVQQGIAAAPKSSDPARQRENLDIFDFSLTPAQMQAISALDVGAATHHDPEVFGH
ncbi:2,5-diketo-D-gluconate reductase A [Leucobacter luti]|uniref:aldo/keto reductase n=1 Tax=Leucobacter luti TaxID=340320 RepID=UPI0010D7C2BC|nr:aldo/keto reductase [Leucobacter luti]MCW2289089.1 2,5-diketo-D-gluconate reductase A [Leucobacter luti]TCK35512.1 2,5-diketo-D-gluconate reductase A [Leucobacter luti]